VQLKKTDMLTYQINSKNYETRYLFIDGGYLDKILGKIGSEFWDTENLEIDYSKLRNGFNKVFYYNCLPCKRNGETDFDFQKRIKTREDFHNGLKLLDSFHVFEGVTFGRKSEIRQKAVDIMIAVDMLRHSYRKNMDKTSLLTGDLDFKPLLDALVLEGMHTSILYSKESISKELLYSADSNSRIRIKEIHDWIPDHLKYKFDLPIFEPSLWIENPILLREGFTDKESINLLGRNENEFWLKIKKEENCSYWKFTNKEKLIRYYEDFFDIKIEWK
jgi:uncharacterized LabA/DUF88 family protein